MASADMVTASKRCTIKSAYLKGICVQRTESTRVIWKCITRLHTAIIFKHIYNIPARLLTSVCVDQPLVPMCYGINSISYELNKCSTFQDVLGPTFGLVK